jgi:hypothetical protein
LYTPTDSGSAVPAITSSLDKCPNVCVGYDTYKQEATKYESSKFPLHFIAAKASVCSAQAVGCDGYTKLGDEKGGGEVQEYFTNLRACVTETMNKGATFFTWEGSDKSGYQLQTWQLLKSNYNDAPCTVWKTVDETSLVCAEGPSTLDIAIKNPSCNDHADIVNNPDCREFVDASGKMHYRLFSETVSVDNACVVYRKDKSTQIDCEGSGGRWTQQGFCRY